jgi:hypothetical protein
LGYKLAMHDHTHATAATVTVSSNVTLAEIQAFLSDGAIDFDVSLKPAPRGRGTELHASTHEGSKSDLKLALARVRSLLETGEVPTGARR